MTQLLRSILFGISLMTTGLALRCYVCMPHKTSSLAGKPSCTPEPATCRNKTHCLSMHRTSSDSKERTYKMCADKVNCVSAHAACLKLMNTSKVKIEMCHAHCCEGDLCNVDDVHKNVQTRKAGKRSDTNGYTVPVISYAMIASLLLMSLLLDGLR